MSGVKNPFELAAELKSKNFKLVETRAREGYTYRLYRNGRGETKQSYEIGDDVVSRAAIMRLLRPVKRRNAGIPNLKPGNPLIGRPGISADPDRVAAVLADAGNLEMNVRDICAKHGISTKTYYKLVRAA